MKYIAPLPVKISAADFAVSPVSALEKQEVVNSVSGVLFADELLFGKNINRILRGQILLPFQSW